MRLIDANTIITALLYDEEHEETQEVKMSIANFLDSHTIEGCPQNGLWISVKDRLPEIDRDVLVYAEGKIDGFFGDHVYALCKRFVQHIFPSSPGYETWSTPWRYFHMDYEITHWMPLPEPPKEDEKHGR